MPGDAEAGAEALRILVVDDDAQLRRAIEQMLIRMGHVVTTAQNGAAALRLADAQPFDLVLTDLVMPEVEGLQLLRELRARPTRLKVIAMSGGGRGSAGDYLELAANMGAVATLPKPFNSQQLAEALETARQANPAKMKTGSER